jgi:hypothetical protein
MLARVWSSLLKVKTELLGVPVPLVNIAPGDRGTRGAYGYLWLR